MCLSAVPALLLPWQVVGFSAFITKRLLRELWRHLETSVFMEGKVSSCTENFAREALHIPMVQQPEGKRDEPHGHLFFLTEISCIFKPISSFGGLES